MRTLSLTVPLTPLAGIFTLLVPLAACSARTNAAPPATGGAVATVAITSGDVAASGTDDHPGGGHHGPGFLVVAALHESIGLSADQRATVAGLAAAGRPAFDQARATALAASVRAGQVTVTDTAPSAEEIAAHRAREASALAALHATLTDAQRRALVDAVEQKQAAHDRSGLPNGKDRARGPLAHLTEGLDLTASQQQEIDAKLAALRPAAPSDAERAAMEARHEAMRAAMTAKLETFASSSFDAGAFVTPPDGALPPPAHGDRFLSEVAVLTSVLDASQRVQLAARIEAGPPATRTDPSLR